MIKGVIYDLDGTIIDTAYIHEAAWLAVAESIGSPITEELIAKQNGIPNETAVELLFPEQTSQGKEKLLQKKNAYIAKHFGRFVETKGVKETIDTLRKKEYQVWICTGASKAFVFDVAAHSSVVESLKEKIVWREMYNQGKPSGEPLLVTLKQMNLPSKEVLFIGDAWSDYQSAKEANISFVYFLADLKKPDTEVPPDIPRIKNHSEIFEYIK